jgi:SAM-dependent methyltransferase
VFRRVSREEASRISLWPDRIDGVKPWMKRSRDPAEVRREYEARYDKMRALWADHRDAASHLAPALRPLSFIHKLNRQNWSQMQSLPHVYGNVDLDRYLVSFQDELYEGSIVAMEAFFRQLVVQTVQRVVDNSGIQTVVELGCGAGFNLINVAIHCGVRAIGCDLSPSAVKLINEIAADSGLQLAARERNFLEGDVSDLIPEGDWAVLTVHAIEQMAGVGMRWFELLLDAKRPPAAGIHIEPLHSAGGRFADDCARYAAINHYNRDFYALAQEAERKGLIDILHFSPRVLGSQAHNPSSVLVWKPKHSAGAGVAW